jgi:hypothetical protein
MVVTGCGGGGDSAPTRTSETAAQQAPRAEVTGGVVDPAQIEACGGFTVDDAAELLGVSAEGIALSYPEFLNNPTLKTCAFEDEATGQGISYSLTWANTAAEMAEQLADERQMVGVAQTSIDAVTGSESEEPASYEIPDIGEEAFFAAVNGTVVARVANVRVQVLNAPDLETRRQVAKRVAARLR